MLSLIPVLAVATTWLLSLRRTPWAVVWLFPCALMAGLGVLIVAAVTGVHHTVPGLIFGELGACTLPLLCGTITEACAAFDDGSGDYAEGGAHKWRKGHPRARLPSRDRWVVRNYSASEGVSLYVERGSAKRLIGQADPLTDMDAFMDLRVKADQAAETLNALKIGAA